MHSAKFEIDIISALSSQLEASFDKLSRGQLSVASLKSLADDQGIYQLYQGEKLVYVGKANNLPSRLREHHLKLTGRRNINVDDMGFKCLYVHKNWTTLAPEASMIAHFKKKSRTLCEWNGNGFGPHDPGRKRELTNKDPDGFDMRYPIKEDWPCTWVEPGEWNVLNLLLKIKDPKNLPFLFRYQTGMKSNNKAENYRKGHPDHRAVNVNVPFSNMPVVELLRLITQALPGWQATAFPSHIILYKERHDYEHGTVIHYEPLVPMTASTSV